MPLDVPVIGQAVLASIQLSCVCRSASPVRDQAALFQEMRSMTGKRYLEDPVRLASITRVEEMTSEAFTARYGYVVGWATRRHWTATWRK
jgi:hypothetical protein